MIEFLRELFFGVIVVVVLYFAWSYGSGSEEVGSSSRVSVYDCFGVGSYMDARGVVFC